jgi:hypothetical protein
MPRDNPAGSSRRCTGARDSLFALPPKHIGSVDPYALKIPARRAESGSKAFIPPTDSAIDPYFEDRCELGQLEEINWDAVGTNWWSGRNISSSVKEGKQAEFLIEECFPWTLVERIGVFSDAIAHRVDQALTGIAHRPAVETRRDWYYPD